MNLLDFLLDVRSISKYYRMPGISDDELDSLIKQVKGDNPVWKITGAYHINETPTCFPLDNMYVSAATLEEAVSKARICHKGYCSGEIYIK